MYRRIERVGIPPIVRDRPKITAFGGGEPRRFYCIETPLTVERLNNKIQCNIVGVTLSNIDNFTNKLDAKVWMLLNHNIMIDLDFSVH